MKDDTNAQGATADEGQATAANDAAVTDAATSEAGVTADEQALLDAQAAQEAADAADEAARANGFADAKAQADAEKAMARKAKPRKAMPKPKGIEVKVAADGFATLQALLADGPITLRFGDYKRTIADLPEVAVRLRAKGNKLVTETAVIMRTAELNKPVEVTHCFACDGKTPLAALELASPMWVSPNQQVVFKAGTLAFFA